MTTHAYGYGLGLYRSVTHGQALGLPMALFALQVLLAQRTVVLEPQVERDELVDRSSHLPLVLCEPVAADVTNCAR